MSAPADVLAVMDADIALRRSIYTDGRGTVSIARTEQNAHNLACAIEARAAVEELIERERKLLAYIAAIKVQATEAPVCDADRLRLVVMYCDDALARVGGGK